jgi:uncharacterized protein
MVTLGVKNLILAAIILFCSPATAQKKDSLKQSALDYQAQLNRDYADPGTSPLSPEDRKNFKGLNFFPYDPAFCVKARLIRTPGERTFQMNTTTDRKPVYVKFGELHFKLNGKACKLNVYQSMDLLNKPEYRDYLFVPFKDLTTDEETYGAGRYIDLTIPAGNELILDFNKSYHPYCAYNHNYSCPVAPPENFLNLKVKAGVRL